MDAENTSLVEQLRQAAPYVPPSHLPSAAELLGVVGALIAYGEFGDRFFEATRDEDDPQAAVDALWTPEDAAEPAPAASPSAAGGAPAGLVDVQAELDDARAENARLLDQLAAAQGAAGRTTATVTPGDSPADVPPAPGASTT